MCSFWTRSRGNKDFSTSCVARNVLPKWPDSDGSDGGACDGNGTPLSLDVLPKEDCGQQRDSFRWISLLSSEGLEKCQRKKMRLFHIFSRVALPKS